ncbi:small oligopeptide transporter [Stereum hirsutum FP-91666 SS1]|uniref:small oligopeptide transporter n=1 Tax=Stereum hirsutum (strain FP-91666) TaxID=721885 RepID=UPI000440EF9B|nr:small oligopeptide transporter [Stereum hirsutum FP-91666 SS1]EIM92032.1 small oligopeptide transporter [Stereum hirsutum FP-91666 SS1]
MLSPSTTTTSRKRDREMVALLTFRITASTRIYPSPLSLTIVPSRSPSPTSISVLCAPYALLQRPHRRRALLAGNAFDITLPWTSALQPYSSAYGGSSTTSSREYSGKLCIPFEKQPDFDDPNIDFASEVTDADWEDESPYPEVRAAVSNTDDIEMPVDTIRAWTIGLLWSILIPGLNQFLYLRYPSITIGSVSPILSPYSGITDEPMSPSHSCPFTVKEHVVITVMATVGSTSAYATDILAVQRKHYDQNWPFGYQWVLVVSSQVIGFSLGGVVKRFLVSPPSMIWPSNLVSCALFNTLHSQEYTGFGKQYGMSRERFFLYGFLGAFVWYFFPGYLFTALSTFSWVTWIAPKNVVRAFLPYRNSDHTYPIVTLQKVNQLFGYTSGLGMSIFTFDWSNIAYLGSPLATPWWAEANVAAGFVMFFWILTPIIYYTNTWYSAYSPMLSRLAYDNKGNEYNVSRVLTAEATLDLAAYEDYSPLFLPATFVISYGLTFASITATLVHSVLYFRKQIWTQARRSLHEQPDVHARLMSRYPSVPEWWYLAIFVIMFILSVLTMELWPTEMPIWALIIAMLIAIFYLIPLGMLQAITNQQIGLNVIAELIAGYALPGKPLASMMFKTYGYITMTQALQFTSDMKLGHYMKVPPRTMFWCQCIASLVACSAQLGVQNWMFSNIDGICQPDQKNNFVCAGAETFFVASVVFGLARSANSRRGYINLYYFFLIGLIAPVIGWVINKRWPSSFFRYVNVPVILSGTEWIPPATAVNYIPWALVGFIFNYIVRKRHFSWWAKYNYVLSAALDCGTAIGTLVVFFCLQYPESGQIGANTILKWWGNTVYKNTADANSTPLRTVSGDDYFGPRKGSW